MRVLTVIPEMGSGGAEAVVETLTRHLVMGGHETWLLSSGGWRIRGLEESGVHTATAPMQGRRPRVIVEAMRSAHRVVSRVNPDVIHAHNVKAAVVARLALRLSGQRQAPLLVTAHGFPPESYVAAARVLRTVRPALVVAVSEDVAERLRGGGFHGPMRVVENTIAPLPMHSRGSARARLQLDEATPVAMCLARMTAQKRHDLLLGAWASQRADAVLLMAGDGPTRGAVEALAAALPPEAPEVRFLGNRSDPDWLLAAADVLVLPSDWEGLPITLLEAMGCGTPVVASAVGGVATLGSGVALVEPQDEAALSARLAHLLGSAPARAEQAAQGRALLEERFDPARMVAAYGEILAELVARRRLLRPI